MKRAMAIIISSVILLGLLVIFVDPMLQDADDITIDAYVAEKENQRVFENGGIWTEDELSDFELLMSSSTDIASNFTDIELKELCTPGAERNVSKADARQDVLTLFRLLKEAYGAYYYFGGDEVFKQAEGAVICELSSITSTGDISSIFLEDIIVRNLQSIISDAHFVIGSTPVVTQYLPYWVPDAYFDYEIEEYSDYMEPTITPEGYIKWGFFATTADFNSLPEYITIEDETIKLNWEIMDTQGIFQEPYYSISSIAGIPVITARSFKPRAGHDGDITIFIESGVLINKNEVVILDLRGNIGGNSIYALNWIQSFVDNLSVKTCEIQRISKPLLAYAKSPESLYDEDYIEWFETQKNQWISGYGNGSMSNNQSTIFVVIDKNVASAAEDLVFWLQHVENVFFVGTNTQGASICGNICIFYLPESNISIQFGTKLNLYGSLVRMDGRGFDPDLWVEPTHAIDYLVEALSKAG